MSKLKPIDTSGNRLIALIISVLLLATVEANAHHKLLAPLVGKWQVMGVRLDETLPRTPNYNYDDPRLVGHLISISGEKITADLPEKSACLEPTATSVLSTPDTLIQQSMGRSKRTGKPNSINFNLPVKGNERLLVLWIGCKTGDIGPDSPYGPEGLNWLAKLPGDQLALRWYDNTILLLKRLPL
jgi:hypothetical protein